MTYTAFAIGIVVGFALFPISVFLLIAFLNWRYERQVRKANGAVNYD